MHGIMTNDAPSFEIFLISVPGFEPTVRAEALAAGFSTAKVVKGGVTLQGGWPDVWRANLVLRGPSRVLARMTSFRVLHLAQLDKRSRRVAWAQTLRADVPVRVEVSCARSRVYHSDAAAERITRAIREGLGAPVSDDADVCIRARIENDVCTIGVDTSGALLHKRGHKEAVNKAPMRETLAALFLRELGYDGSVPVLDPMCGSGTFVIEAAEIAAGLLPGRSRQFAFEHLATFDPAAWERMRGASAPIETNVRFYGSDKDPGAIRMSRANAERAGVARLTAFEEQAIHDLTPPDSPPGLVIVNPPYGDRLGDKARLAGLYRSLGQRLAGQFKGWRVGLITNDASLANATGLPFASTFGPVSHGGLRVFLHATDPIRA
jgi:putative N6-adenine-specific DNA methylase